MKFEVPRIHILSDVFVDVVCLSSLIKSWIILFSHSLEWFSFECRKTKTKVITLANHIGHRQYIEPIKTRSNYMWLTQSAGKCMRARHNWLWFYFFFFFFFYLLYLTNNYNIEHCLHCLHYLQHSYHTYNTDNTYCLHC